MIRRLWALLREDLELLLFTFFGVSATGLAALVGRPQLALVGLLTVAPFLAAAWLRRRG